jgi:serine/threonine-protein kinase
VSARQESFPPEPTQARGDVADGMRGMRVQDRYELLRRLAVGGMGEIFLARQSGIVGADRLVTIKTLLPHLAEQPDSLQDFLDEARLVSRLNHPGIVSILEVGMWRGVHFIAMEYVHGRSLSNIWSTAAREQMPIPLVIGAEVVRNMALALDHAHHARDEATGREVAIIHRDVSPHNIMVRFDGLSKLLDFGIAKAAGESPERTQTGVVKGKIAYMSPEQLLGQPLSPAVDQVALGVILWEFSTGKRLMSGSDVVANMRKMMKSSLQPPSLVRSSFPRPLEAIIMRMLAVDPAQRFPTCGDAARALHSFLMWACAGREPTAVVQEFLGKLYGAEARSPIDLKPSPVTIHGLTPDLVVCQFCQQKVAASSPYCSSCGQPLRMALARTMTPMSMSEMTVQDHKPRTSTTMRSGVFHAPGGAVPIIGRDGELAGARAIVSKAATGKGSAALFVGAHGSGRSRVLEAIAGIASLEGHVVASTRGHPRGDNVWCRVFEAVSTSIVGEMATPIVGYNCLPVLASLPGLEEQIDAIGAPFSERDPVMDPKLLARMFDAYLHVSGVRSLSIIIDDIDCLRNNERTSLLGLIDWMSSSRMTVVAAGLPGSEERFPGLRKITLEAMSPRDIHKLAELTLRGSLPKTVRELLDRARGLPGNVGVVLGTLVQAGVLVRVDKEWLAFPGLARDMAMSSWPEHVADALSSLSARAQDILREAGERGQPTRRSDFQKAGDINAVEELLSLGLFRQHTDGHKIDVSGSSVLERLFPKAEFDLEVEA